jgi:hypothetical protein
MTRDRTSALPAFPHRTVINAFLSLLALAVANEVFDWRLVADYDWEWIVAMTVLGANVLPFLILTGLRRQRLSTHPGH